MTKKETLIEQAVQKIQTDPDSYYNYIEEALEGYFKRNTIAELEDFVEPEEDGGESDE